MVVILHFPESPLRALLIRFLKLAKRWSGVGVVTKGARHFLESQLGIDPGKIFQYFAVRIDHFRPPEDHRMTGGPILSIGVAKRDYPTLIEALAELPGYQTEIFTTSKYGHRYEGQNFSEVPGWIRFPGRVSDDDLINHYQACRFVVVPLQPTAHSGAGATTVLEASASGKAVIATNTNGMNSMVIHGKTGLLVPPRDVRAMRDALKTLYENADLAAEMGRAGRKFVEENYNYGSVFCETTVFLQNLWQSHHQAAD